MLIFLAKNMTVCDRTESNWNGPIFSATTEPCNINYRHTFNRIFFGMWPQFRIHFVIVFSDREHMCLPMCTFGYLFSSVFLLSFHVLIDLNGWRFIMALSMNLMCSLKISVRLLAYFVCMCLAFENIFSQQNENTKKEIDLCFKLWPSLTQMNENICTQKPQLKV